MIRGLRRILKLLFLAAALLILALAAITFLRDEQLNQSRFEDVNAIRVELDVGSIEVVGVAGTEVVVRRTERSWIVRPKFNETIRDGVLRLRAECSVQFISCSVDYRIEVPPSTDLVVQTSSGDLSISGITGRVKADTAAGNIEVDDSLGPLSLRTFAGAVEGDGLKSTEVKARTVAGGIKLSFLEAPASLTARTDAGNILLLLPDDGFDVETSAKVGRAEVAVQQDRTKNRTIDARTLVGNIRVQPIL